MDHDNNTAAVPSKHISHAGFEDCQLKPRILHVTALAGIVAYCERSILSPAHGGYSP